MQSNEALPDWLLVLASDERLLLLGRLCRWTDGWRGWWQLLPDLWVLLQLFVAMLFRMLQRLRLLQLG